MRTRIIPIFLLGCFLSGTAALPQTVGKSSPQLGGLPTEGRTDLRTRRYLTPVRIVWQQAPELIEGAQRLLESGNGQASTQNNSYCILHATEGRHPALLLDFGRELQGGLKIVTGMAKSQQPVHLRIRFGESVSEAMCEIDGKNGATNDHAMRDFTLAVPWLGSVECGNSGFRFVRIDLLDDQSECLLRQVEARFEYRDIPYLGSFRSNDERLNRIWMTGAYTVQLNMQDYLWDGIKRDRLIWVGDMHPEIMTICSAFGYNEVVPRSLDCVRDLTPLPAWMNGISSYSLWWILIQRDWYLYQGDFNYLRQQKSYLTGLLEQLCSHISADGHEMLDGMRFLDWPSSNDSLCVDAGLQALTLMALRAGGDLAERLQEQALAAKCRQQAEKMQQYRIKSYGAAKQGAALMTLAGLIDPKQADRDCLSRGGSAGFSTFYGYYMLKAMAAAGDYTGALDRIREYWGAMLDLGATTFWEDFNLAWLPAGRIDEPIPAGMRDLHRDCGDYCYRGFRHSLCHGWASGPTAWLSEYVLGVEPVEAGCRRLRITPHLGDLQWVEGTFPTPLGVVEIRHERLADGSVQSRIKAPRGIKIECKSNHK